MAAGRAGQIGQDRARSLPSSSPTQSTIVFGRAGFRGTERAFASGYFYFLVNAGIGFVITISLFAMMIRLTSVNYLVARVAVSVIAGLTVFLLNAVLNFRRL